MYPQDNSFIVCQLWTCWLYGQYLFCTSSSDSSEPWNPNLLSRLTQRNNSKTKHFSLQLWLGKYLLKCYQMLSEWHPMHPWLQVSIWPVKDHLGWFGSIGFMFSTHILESLEAAPPVTLATRSWDNSFFRSSSCFSSSSFFLPRRSLALILAWMTENKQTRCKESMGINTPSVRLTRTTQHYLTLSSVRYTFALLRGNIQATCYQY